MFKIKLISSFLLLIFSFNTYSQKGFSVDKDYRIKKYQKEIIQFLIDDNQFGVRKEALPIKNYLDKIGIKKCIEIFLNDENILLVRFYSLGSGANNYWGILKKSNKYLFYYNEKDFISLETYLKKHDFKTQKIILEYLKTYTIWDGPNLHSPHIIDEKAAK